MNERITTSQHRLAELINDLGITQNEFAKRTGLNKGTISNYLSGKREPKQDQIYIISKTFNVDPAWLMGLDVPMHKMSPQEKAYEMALLTKNAKLQEPIRKMMQLPDDKVDFIINQIDFLYGQEMLLIETHKTRK